MWEKKKNQREEFPSSSVLLEIAKDEYDKELDRFRYLDNKASFFLTTIILVATLFIPSIPFGDLKDVFGGGKINIRWIVGILLLMLTVAFLLLIVAFIKLYRVYDVQEFNRFDYNHLVREELHRDAPDDLQVSLCNNYKKIIEANAQTNKDKADGLTEGIKYCGAGFLLFFVSAMGLMIAV